MFLKDLSVTKFVRKEESGLKTSTLSVVSAITLRIRSGCLSLTDRAPESSLRLSPLNPCSMDALFGLSTPITAIRDRCSSFCTWPTYLPLSPESFSRCRLRWTTPPSPHGPSIIMSFYLYKIVVIAALFTIVKWDIAKKNIMLCIWCNAMCLCGLRLKKHIIFHIMVHYCCSSMPRLSEVRRFL